MKDYKNSIRDNLKIDDYRTLKDAVYAALRKTIILGEIPAGQRINELELADALNISRTPIRYALTELAKQQLVTHEPRIGMIVKGISIKDVYEIYKIRLALDTLATVEAVKNMDDNDFDALEEILLTGNKLNDNHEVDELLENFSAFNDFIFEKTDMPRLRSTIMELKAYLDYFRDVSIRSTERRSIALNEHWLIFQGMKNNNRQQIEMIIKEHLNHSLEFIVKEMERRHID